MRRGSSGTPRAGSRRLLDEHDALVSYSTVRDYVRRRRPGIAVEHGKVAAVAMIPQDHAAGAEAEVDFGEVWVLLDGVKTKCHLFVYRLSHSGCRGPPRLSPCGQEAFLQGTSKPSRFLGGIPTGHIRYDNLTSAVSQVLYGSGRRRSENPRWVLFRSHHRIRPVLLPTRHRRRPREGRRRGRGRPVPLHLASPHARREDPR